MTFVKFTTPSEIILPMLRINLEYVIHLFSFTQYYFSLSRRSTYEMHTVDDFSTFYYCYCIITDIGDMEPILNHEITEKVIFSQKIIFSNEAHFEISRC